MARQKPADQVETLKKKQAELAARLKEASARARAHEQEIHGRKCELLGSLALWDMETRPKGALATALRALMQTQFTKAADRALFDLPPLPKPEAASAATDAPAASGARKAPVDAGSDKG
jgi:hypothetical protein